MKSVSLQQWFSKQIPDFNLLALWSPNFLFFFNDSLSLKFIHYHLFVKPWDCAAQEANCFSWRGHLQKTILRMIFLLRLLFWEMTQPYLNETRAPKTFSVLFCFLLSKSPLRRSFSCLKYKPLSAGSRPVHLHLMSPRITEGFFKTTSAE